MQRNSESRRFEIQARKAQVIEIEMPLNRSRLLAEDRALIDRFEFAGLRKVAVEFRVPEARVENALRRRLALRELPRVA